jgi:hypothetical protein
MTDSSNNIPLTQQQIDDLIVDLKRRYGIQDDKPTNIYRYGDRWYTQSPEQTMAELIQMVEDNQISKVNARKHLKSLIDQTYVISDADVAKMDIHSITFKFYEFPKGFKFSDPPFKFVDSNTIIYTIPEELK